MDEQSVCTGLPGLITPPNENKRTEKPCSLQNVSERTGTNTFVFLTPIPPSTSLSTRTGTPYRAKIWTHSSDNSKSRNQLRHRRRDGGVFCFSVLLSQRHLTARATWQSCTADAEAEGSMRNKGSRRPRGRRWRG